MITVITLIFLGISESLKRELSNEANLRPDEFELRNLLNDVPRWLLNAKSTNTVKKYSSYFKKFQNFMITINKCCLPSRSIDVVFFCTKLLNDKTSHHVITSCIYAIKYMHNLHNYVDPTENCHVKNLIECSKRVNRKPVCKKDVVSPDIIKDLFTKYSASEDVTVLRDLSMIIVSYSGFLRYDEMSSIRCQDISFHDDYVNVHLVKSKTDQYRDGG